MSYGPKPQLFRAFLPRRRTATDVMGWEGGWLKKGLKDRAGRFILDQPARGG